MHALDETQGRFAVALFDSSAPVSRPLRGARTSVADSRGVHRNTARQGLLNALAARFPVVRRLLSDESFSALARRYTIHEPPRSPVLLHYGDTFPRFIRSLDNAASFQYLADIAELEMVRGRARHAAHANPLGRESFAALSGDERDVLNVVFHPSVSLVTSRFPIVTIWEQNRDGGDNEVRRWKAEAALVVRPFLQVNVWCLPAGGYDFLRALSEGGTMAAAAAIARASAEDFSLADNLMVLIEAGAAIGLRRG